MPDQQEIKDVDANVQPHVGAHCSSLRLYTIFHLNLAYSSIEQHQRQEVLNRCYWPLLRLVDQFSLPIGIEASGFTLEVIARLDPDWIATLKRLLNQGTCDFLGSGYTQIIGPLVPAKVNVANLKLGMEVYRDLLSVIPRIAFVSEQAFSTGLIELYHDVGFRALVMDWDNPATFNPHWPKTKRYTVERVGQATGAVLDLLWNSSIAFQQFQRYVMGETPLEDYLVQIRLHLGDGVRNWSLYGNDAEVFGYRPGRYVTEAPLITDEWDRVGALFSRLIKDPDIELLSPTKILEKANDEVRSGPPLILTTAVCPIPVKKQPKYNISRWAVTGRDDVWINTACHRLARRLPVYDGEAARDPWRGLCRAWSSDLRTHVTPLRWQSALDELQELANQIDQPLPLAHRDLAPLDGRELKVKDATGPDYAVQLDPSRFYLTIKTKQARVVLNLRRGLAIQTAAFGETQSSPIIGTLPHGYFDSIELGADFYTGSVVVELTEERRRITDLCLVNPVLTLTSSELVCDAIVNTDKGSIRKRIAVSLHEPKIRYEVAFPHWSRPLGTLRMGHITLLPTAFSGPLRYECVNGGKEPESFNLDRFCMHSAPVSTLVSCTTGLGATDGRITVGDDKRAVELSWAPWQCAAFPMIQHRESAPANLTRILFSLCEMDETSREGGHLPPFSLCIREKLR